MGSFQSPGMLFRHHHNYNPEWGDKWNSENRIEIGFGMMYTNYYYEGSYENYEYAKVYDVKYYKQIRPASSFSFIMGYSYPLTKFGEKTTLALTVNCLYNLFKGRDDSVRVSSGTVLSGLAAEHIGLPVSLDFKSGADAVYDKQYNFMYNFGLGFMPNFSTYKIDGESFRTITAAPFVKAEVGVRFGIAMKLRVMYVYRNSFINYDGYDDMNNKYGPQKLQLNYKGNLTQDPELTVALVIMPFSFMWEKYK
jgi:hypothetical protein